MSTAMARTIAPRLGETGQPAQKVERVTKRLQEHEHERPYFSGLQVNGECSGGFDDYRNDCVEHLLLCRVSRTELQSFVVHGPDRIRHCDLRSRFPQRLRACHGKQGLLGGALACSGHPQPLTHHAPLAQAHSQLLPSAARAPSPTETPRCPPANSSRARPYPSTERRITRRVDVRTCVKPLTDK